MNSETITQTFYNKECNRFGITWHAEKAENPVLLITKDKSDFVNALCISVNVEKGSGDLVLRAVTPPLDYSAKYYYKVGDKEFSDIGEITTPCKDIKEYKFLFVTDSQDEVNNGKLFKATLDDAFKFSPDIKFIIHGGDIVNTGGSETDWQQMMMNTAPYSMNCTTVPTAGNHDYWDWALCGNSHTCFRHYTVDLPKQNTYRGMYFGFDYGLVHYSVLNSGDTVEYDNGLSKAQLEWLDNDLLGAQDKWKIVIVHNPLYSPGKYGSDESKNLPARVMAKQLNPLFEKHKVALCLNGHDHVFSRSYPINGMGKPYVSSDRYTRLEWGTVHHMAGCAGNQNRDFYEYLGDEYKEKLFDIRPVGDGIVTYSVVSVFEDKITVTYREVNSETKKSETVKCFGIIK